MPAFLKSHWFAMVVRGCGWMLLLVSLAWLGNRSMSRALADIERDSVHTPRASLSAALEGRGIRHGTRVADAVPSQGEAAAAGPSASASAGPSASAFAGLLPACKGGAGGAFTADGKLILNVAESEDLKKLPGIGHKRAESILALRKRLGRFRRLVDLLRIRGIGPRSLQRLRPLVVVDPPKR